MTATHDAIADALAHIPADDRETWLRAGMAVKHALGDAGRDTWMAWSATSPRYRERDAAAVWRSIRPDGPVTAGTLYHLARQHGWRGGATRVHRPAPTPRAVAEPMRWSARADAIWRRARPLDGTDPASRYLQGRKCVIPPADGDLRWLPASEGHPWARMVGRVTEALTGEPLTLHLTALDGARKAPIERPRRLLAGHRKAGGVIRLWPDDAVTHGLAVAEGIETALAAAHGFTPVWSCIDAGNLAGLPVLAGIECLTICADHDDAGQRAAESCARRWHEAGREVAIVTAPTAGHDLADVVAA